MRPELEYPPDKRISRKRKAIKRELSEQKGLLEKHIAILGGSTTTDIREMLELFLLNYGIRPVFYESEYAQYWQDAMFENKELKTLAPDVIYIHTSNRNITAYPEITDSYDDIVKLFEQQMSHFTAMWERLYDVYHCTVIQNNFEYPYYRILGNQDAADIHGRINYINRLNDAFYNFAREHDWFLINDINYQSASFGLEKWSDPFYWHMYKYALSTEAIPYLSLQVANIIKALFGKNKKAIALDLDNTLWGGVVGDDGVENLELGQETSMGQAFTEFQEYLKSLSKTGVLLNIISKNDEENAYAGLDHPQMILKKDDFISIKANWEPKSSNLIQMAEELSLLPESFVFADDNPAEREIIRQQVPGAAIPALTEVEHYISAIDHGGYFEVVKLSADDLKRNDMYKENAARIRQQQTFTDYRDYLLSLSMKADIKPFEPIYMSRIAQLTNKSNQFNLTTRRCTAEEIESLASDDSFITLYGKLSDCFGDNGVVTVVIGQLKDDTCDIILWLMSCRVLKRDMEYAMMDELVRICKLRGINRINGYYYPTAKNGMVKDFYDDQGFSKASEDDAGNTTWQLDISGSYENKNTVIKVNEEELK